MEQLGENLGKGFELLALIATLLAASATLLAWSLLIHFGRRRAGLRAAGLVLVVAVHFLPIFFTLADPKPTSSWSFSSQWRGWGAAAAWSLPGFAALLWFAPLFAGESARARVAARSAIAIAYGAVMAATIHLYQPAALREPLTAIVTTPREQWACGTTADGTVFCLGGNEHGQLGAGEPNLERPRQVEELSPSSALFMGRFVTCGLRPPSTVRCVGLWHGQSNQRFSATSSLVISNVLVGEDELAFVSKSGEVEVWSEQGNKPIAANSAKQVQCGAQLILLGGGQAEMRHTRSGRRVELGPAREIGCEENAVGGRIALLDRARLRYFTASGEPDEEVQVTESAAFAPSDSLIALRDGDAVARCAAGFAVFHRVAVSCDWVPTKRKPVRLSGTPAELADSVEYSAQRLAAMSLARR